MDIFLVGVYGDNSLYGSYGSDFLFGDSVYDYLNCGYGVDILTGETGSDALVGGYDASADTFAFTQGDSNSYSGGADISYDWKASYD